MDQNKQQTKTTVYQVMSKVINQLVNSLEVSSTKAKLASLRNSIGRELGQSNEVWPLILDHMPDEFLGRGEKLNEVEEAVINALQLYALYQQGQNEPMHSTEGKGWENMGTAFSTLRIDDNRIASDRRFNALITSDSYEELIYHLRQMISLLKAKSKGKIKIDFAKLSQDLFWFNLGYKDNIRIAWPREYYRNRKQKLENSGEKNEQ